MYPLTLFSSTAKVFMAACIRSKLVGFQTKSAMKPWVTSAGTPSDLLSSKTLSSETSFTRKVVSENENNRQRKPNLTIGNFDNISDNFPSLAKLSRVSQ